MTERDTIVADEHPRRGGRALLRELGMAALVGLLSVLAAVWVQQLWNARLHIPFAPGGDQTFTLVGIKTVLEQGWYDFNPFLGAPFGSSLPMFAVQLGDASQLLLVRLLGVFSSDAAAVINALYLIGFGLCGSLGYIAFRILGFGRVVAVVTGVLFATLHYHFFRAQSHLFLGTYYAVPAIGVLTLGSLGHVKLFSQRDGARLAFGWLTWRNVAVVVGALLVGTSDSYYAIFGVLTLIVVAPIAALATGRFRNLATPLVLAGIILGAAVAIQLPSLLYSPPQPEAITTPVGVRTPQMSEVYGLKFIDLVMPIPNHRLPFLSEIGKLYWSAPTLPGEGSSPALGTLGALGLVTAMLTALVAAVRNAALPPRLRMLRDAGVVSWLLVFMGTVGGGSALIAYLVSPQVRGWNRISVVIAFFALTSFAILLEATGRWLSRKRVPRPALGAAAAAVLVVGVLDQTSTADVIAHDAVAAQWRVDSRYVDAVERNDPRGMILQLPYVPFPENPPVGSMLDYDNQRPYLHSKSLRWSSGAVKGQLPEDWQAGTAAMPTNELLVAACAAGFTGLSIDRFGYEDRGAELVPQVAQFLGAGPATESADARLTYFDLRPLQARVKSSAPGVLLKQASAELLGRSVTTQYGDGFYPEETGRGHRWHWAGQQGVLLLSNTTGRPQTQRLTFGVETAGSGQDTVSITLPGGKKRVLRGPGGRVRPVKLDVTVPTGQSRVSFTTTGPDVVADPRDLRMQVSDLRLAGPALSQLLATVAPTN